MPSSLHKQSVGYLRVTLQEESKRTETQAKDRAPDLGQMATGKCLVCLSLAISFVHQQQYVGTNSSNWLVSSELCQQHTRE